MPQDDTFDRYMEAVKVMRPWTVSQAAEYMGVADGTVRRYIKEGTLKATKFNGHYYISQRDCFELMGVKYDARLISALMMAAK